MKAKTYFLLLALLFGFQVESSKLLDLISSEITPISLVSFENKLWFLFTSPNNIDVKSSYDISSLKEINGKVILYDPEKRSWEKLNLNLDLSDFNCDGIYLDDKELILSGSTTKEARVFLVSPDFNNPISIEDTDCIGISKKSCVIMKDEDKNILIQKEKVYISDDLLQATDLIKILIITDSKVYIQLKSTDSDSEICVIDITDQTAQCSNTTPSLYAQLQDSLYFIRQEKINFNNDDYVYTSIESLQLNYLDGYKNFFPTQSISPSDSDPTKDVPHVTHSNNRDGEPFDGYYFYYIGIFVILCVTMGVLIRRYCQKPTSIDNNVRMNLSSLLHDPTRKETKDNNNENI